MSAPAKLKREIFKTSRLIEFCSEKELINQTGYAVSDWPCVILKELIDNAIDACEETGIAPVISVVVRDGMIMVADNGPGIGPKVVKDLTDYSSRTSSREAYVSPCRGAQGNFLKCLLAMPFVLDGGKMGETIIISKGMSHHIKFSVDHIRQEPKITLDRGDSDVRTGTRVAVGWPVSACSKLENAKSRFLQIASGFGWLNPHLTLEVDWKGEKTRIEATDPDWRKWRPSDPTSPWWYTEERLVRLMGAYIARDQDRGREPRTVREFISEFRGLSGTAKQKEVLDKVGASRVALPDYFENGINLRRVAELLAAMQSNSREVKPKDLGLIGETHLQARFIAAGADERTFRYSKQFVVTDDHLPQVIEVAFGFCPKGSRRQLVAGVNWSPGINNPFRVLGQYGQSLDSYLSEQRAGNPDEPITLVIHMACPRVDYTDRGKSALVISGVWSSEQAERARRYACDDEEGDDGEG
jgi:DNA topoisomerase VI subunit B